MVSSVGFVLWIVLAFTGVIAYRRRDDRRFLILTAGGIVGSGLGFATLVGGSPRLWGPIDILPAVMAFITIAEAFASPRPSPSASGWGSGAANGSTTGRCTA